MPRVCYFTGRKTSFGKQVTHRGKAKYLGGVGTKVTGVTARKFKPNIQKVRAVIDGQVVVYVWQRIAGAPSDWPARIRRRGLYTVRFCVEQEFTRRCEFP